MISIREDKLMNKKARLVQSNHSIKGNLHTSNKHKLEIDFTITGQGTDANMCVVMYLREVSV